MTRTLTAAAAGAALLLAASPLGAPVGARAATGPTLQQLIGQKLVVSMDGTKPSASLLTRAKRGKIGGVIIHSTNFASAAGLRGIATQLQQAAASGGQPPLLIAVDQEGGPVKTIKWIAPTISPRRMGELGSSDVARRQGRRPGQGRDLPGLPVRLQGGRRGRRVHRRRTPGRELRRAADRLLTS